MTNLIAQIVAALILVESNGNPAAIGDGGRAVGVLQMWPVAVEEANRIERIEAKREGRAARTWTLADRRSVEASREMCAVTLRFHYRRGTRGAVELAGKWRNPYSACPGWYRERVRKAMRTTHTGGPNQ